MQVEDGDNAKRYEIMDDEYIQECQPAGFSLIEDARRIGTGRDQQG